MSTETSPSQSHPALSPKPWRSCYISRQLSARRAVALQSASKA